MDLEYEFKKLKEEIIDCKKCKRLVTYLQYLSTHKPRRFREWEYWAKPLPGFGDPKARLLIIGLAPAAQGGNRTGRMFTGDRSGEWLFRALYQSGFANQPTSTHRGDGLSLNDCYITATIRCAPPKNKPFLEEIENCRTYLLKELDLLKEVKIIIPLGQIAFMEILRALRLKGYKIPSLPFGHGRTYVLSKEEGDSSLILMATYHPSQQNTFTSRLTRLMFHRIFNRARKTLEKMTNKKDFLCSRKSPLISSRS
ncbi:MAG: uracil-DNA glycosylase [Thermodesulfobacteriota bacterium]